MKYAFMYVTAALIVGSGCSSAVKVPVDAIASAEASIELAEQNGAQQFSVEELTKARQKLKQVKRYVTDEEYANAEQLAMEADVDARLSAALASLRKSEKSADEVDSVLKALDAEVNGS